jgi:hypothetical protein
LALAQAEPRQGDKARTRSPSVDKYRQGRRPCADRADLTLPEASAGGTAGKARTRPPSRREVAAGAVEARTSTVQRHFEAAGRHGHRQGTGRAAYRCTGRTWAGPAGKTRTRSPSRRDGGSEAAEETIGFAVPQSRGSPRPPARHGSCGLALRKAERGQDPPARHGRDRLPAVAIGIRGHNRTEITVWRYLLDRVGRVTAQARRAEAVLSKAECGQDGQQGTGRAGLALRVCRKSRRPGVRGGQAVRRPGGRGCYINRPQSTPAPMRSPRASVRHCGSSVFVTARLRQAVAAADPPD